MNEQNNFSYLIDVYKESKMDEEKFVYTQSIHWDKRYKKNQKFLELNNLINFRNNRVLSAGLDDSINLTDKLDLFQLLESFDVNLLKKTLPDKNVGNCENSVNFLGYYFDYGIVHHINWYQDVEKYIKNNSFVLEIGGGFGSFARMILKNKDVKYFFIELPEANLMINYYLQSHFPEKKIFNYSDYKKLSLKENIEKFDIFILPPKILDKENINYDFIINTRSFMEMNKKIINEYFTLIQNKINQGGYFLNVNRYYKSTVDEDIKFEEYPYDAFWNVEISKKSYLQKHIHFLLAKRTNIEGNISSELIDLKKKNLEHKSAFRVKYHYFKSNLTQIFFNIAKKILRFLFSKKKLNKISSIIRSISKD